jgi:hypothetical protein
MSTQPGQTVLPSEAYKESFWGNRRGKMVLRIARVPKFELREITDLSALVLERMNEDTPDDSKKNRAWVGAQFQYPLRSWLIKANWNSFTFVALSMVVVGGGFATSGIAAAAGAGKGSAASWFIFAIGLIVALVGGISQQFRFGVRANERRTLAVGLREEGWRFVYKVGDYGCPEALPKFRAKVEELHQLAAKVAIVEGEASHPTTPPTAPSGGGDGKPKVDLAKLPEGSPEQG